MQFLEVKENTTLADLFKQVGDGVNKLLHLNGVKRVPNVGRAFIDMCTDAVQGTSDVSNEKRASLLNGVTTDSDIFEHTALMGDDGWKLFSTANTLPGFMRVPDEIKIPDSVQVMGNGESVKSSIYNKVMTCLKSNKPIDPSIFNNYSTSSVGTATTIASSAGGSGDLFQWFKLPWGEVTLYSSLDDSRIDFPVYPEELGDSRKANYITMPDILYQYEPWQLYKDSGPRTQTYSFHFHRDMWTGDHRDGKANELIRACMANLYPEYRGSAVYTSYVIMYIHGQAAIRGILTDVTPHWSGPIGLDGWWLECKLDLTITEVSETPLNFNTVKNKPLIG